MKDWKITKWELDKDTSILKIEATYIKPIDCITVTFTVSESKCECGGETCGTIHRDWCAKYKKL